MRLSIAFVASLIASVSAHATFQEMWVNGVDQGSSCVRLPMSNSPVSDVTSNVSRAILANVYILISEIIGHHLQCKPSCKQRCLLHHARRQGRGRDAPAAQRPLVRERGYRCRFHCHPLQRARLTRLGAIGRPLWPDQHLHGQGRRRHHRFRTRRRLVQSHRDGSSIEQPRLLGDRGPQRQLRSLCVHRPLQYRARQLPRSC